MKRKRWLGLLLSLIFLLLSGCMPKAEPTEETDTGSTAVTVPLQVQETIPADGDPENVTCKGSYTAEVQENAVVAVVGDAQLTNEQLQSWYWAAVAQYRQSGISGEPDFTKALDVQKCQEKENVNSWQQFFLDKALNAWHSAQALRQQAGAAQLTAESTYIPDAKNHEKYMTGAPATAVLYGYDKTYAVNTMHQAFLDEIPALLDALALEKGYADGESMARAAGSSRESLIAFSQLYNYAYTYLTFLSYDLMPDQEEVENWYEAHQAEYMSAGITVEKGQYVDIRQILLTPDAQSEDARAACEAEARNLLKQWNQHFRKSEWLFAEMAQKHSQDTGTAAGGGLYRNIEMGQLPEALEAWCFAPERKAGDTAIVSTEQGIHLLYFVKATPIWQSQAAADLLAQMEKDLIASARSQYPMEVDYSSITLSQGEGVLSYEEVLYPDIAHERYPEVPLYLQQDYPRVFFGNAKISTDGCGITTFAMLASYMSDEEWTPPEMCSLYSKYSTDFGTDGTIFMHEPSKFGFFFRERAFDPKIAMAALEEGCILVSAQAEGYWTRAGHYILLEKLTEDGMVQVRDSNLFNYLRIPAHQEDKHKWGNITSTSRGYWIFEKKITKIGACSRCGTPDPQTNLAQNGYLCERCSKALIRRNAYLAET